MSSACAMLVLHFSCNIYIFYLWRRFRTSQRSYNGNLHLWHYCMYSCSS